MFVLLQFTTHSDRRPWYIRLLYTIHSSQLLSPVSFNYIDWLIGLIDLGYKCKWFQIAQASYYVTCKALDRNWRLSTVIFFTRSDVVPFLEVEYMSLQDIVKALDHPLHLEDFNSSNNCAVLYCPMLADIRVRWCVFLLPSHG